MPPVAAAAGDHMDAIYRGQRHIYDLTRKYYLLGRDGMIAGLRPSPKSSVLEIGCNSGFLSLTLAPGTRRYVAFDNNPFLVEIARLTQSEISDASVEFRVDTMEAFDTAEKFDVVLSFANHSTWDGNMPMALKAYFSKLRDLTIADGTLFFESHHPALENADQVRETLKVMQTFFSIEEEKTLARGSAWDRGRTFVHARAKADTGR